MAMVIITQKPEIATQYGVRRRITASPPSLGGVSGVDPRIICIWPTLAFTAKLTDNVYREFLILPTANDGIPSHLHGVSSHLNRRFSTVLLDWHSKEGLVR